MLVCSNVFISDSTNWNVEITRPHRVYGSSNHSQIPSAHHPHHFHALFFPFLATLCSFLRRCFHFLGHFHFSFRHFYRVSGFPETPPSPQYCPTVHREKESGGTWSFFTHTLFLSLLRAQFKLPCFLLKSRCGHALVCAPGSASKWAAPNVSFKALISSLFLGSLSNY